MESWLKLSIWIGTYGFLKEYRPEDPYLFQYLTNAPMNFTVSDVESEIYPIATYTTLTLSVFVFLLTDWLRYKPMIMTHATCGVIMQILLIWGRTKSQMFVMEVSYGAMQACEVAYYTYIYAKVDKEHYQKVTSHMRSASLCGRFISAITSQLLLMFNLVTIAGFNYFTLAGMLLALMWSLTLPSVKTSIYFHRTNSAVNFNECSKSAGEHTKITCCNDLEQDSHIKSSSSSNRRESCSVSHQIWTDFKLAYTNSYVLKWSLWCAFATCGYNQVMTYSQTLWDAIKDDNTTTLVHNGAVEAIYTLTSAGAAFSFGYVKMDWKVYGELLLGVLTLSEGLLVVWSAHLDNIIYAYLVYVLFGMMYHIMMTVTYSEIAKHIRSDSYALIFGLNNFIALTIQTLLMIFVAQHTFIVLSTRCQFVIYGAGFIILGSIFCVKGVFSRASYIVC